MCFSFYLGEKFRGVLGGAEGWSEASRYMSKVLYIQYTLYVQVRGTYIVRGINIPSNVAKRDVNVARTGAVPLKYLWADSKPLRRVRFLPHHDK